MCILVSFAPEAVNDDYAEFLLQRVRARAGHPTFPSDAAAQAEALSTTLAAMEWPGGDEAAAGGSVVLPCDPRDPPSVEALAARVFRLCFWSNG